MENDRIQYRRCEERDVDSLKRLWPMCFEQDSAEEIEEFFNKVYSIAVPFAGFDNNTAVTMLYLLPAHARGIECDVPVWYLYAGGTHPSYRSNGYYRRLMEVAREWAFTSDRFAIYLHPAEQSLFQYYADLGYTEEILSYFHQGSLPMGRSCEISMDEYLHRRENMLSRSVVLWQPIRSIVDSFVGDEWHAAVGDDGVLQLADSTKVLEQLPLSIDSLNNDNGALWIPTTEDVSIINRLKRSISYSSIYGD